MLESVSWLLGHAEASTVSSFVVTLTLLPCGCFPTEGGARVSRLSSAGRAAYRGLPFALVGLILVACAWLKVCVESAH
jgi:hypothetical protein